MDVSSSTVRSELAELETLGLLTHPHTSAGRVPTENGYRVYAEQLVDAIDGRPEADPGRHRLGAQRARGCTALDDGDALAGDAPARARLGARARRGGGSPRRRPAAAAARRDRRRDHVDRRRHQARARARTAGRPGARRLGAQLPRRAGGRLRLGLGDAAPPARGSALPPSELAFLARLRTAFVDAVADDGPQLYMGGAAGLLGEARGAELEACQHLLDVLERRAAVLELLSDALILDGPSSASAPRSTAASSTTSRTSAPHTASPTARSGRWRCSGRCAWTTRRRFAQSGRRRSSSRAWPRMSTRTSKKANQHDVSSWAA